MTEIKHIVNIYMALENYIEKLNKNGNEALEEDVKDTLNWLLEKKVTEIIPLGQIR